MSLWLYSVLFLAIVALAVAECAQIVGVLLVFALMVGPAAAAQRLTTRIGSGLLLSAGLALAEAWAGITLAFYTDWPSQLLDHGPERRHLSACDLVATHEPPVTSPGHSEGSDQGKTRIFKGNNSEGSDLGKM